MNQDEANNAKRELCEKLLVPGTVLIILDARHDGVTVPPEHTGDPKLHLNIDYRFGAPLTVDDWGIAATLSFGGVEFDCVLPWEAIYVFVPHNGSQPYIFPDDVPDEVLEEIGVDAPPEQRPALRLVSDKAERAAKSMAAEVAPAPEPEASLHEPDDAAPDPDEPPPAGKRRGHLRVVK